MLKKIKYFFVGSPLPNEQLYDKKLNKVRALAAFSPDALSSIAYANQEIFLGLAVAGAAGLAFSFPIALTITLLLATVALSYAQTIRAYPSGGGAYVVARENLGSRVGLVAGAALMVSYILTAAVSLSAGVAEIASAFPLLWPYRMELALLLLLVLTLLNLRGMQEAGTGMAIPVYLFLFAFLGMLAFGFVRALVAPEMATPYARSAPDPVQPLTLLLVLRAFSSGCTALTGIEAISNGVPAFRQPEVRNARITLIVMAVLMGMLFMGSIGLGQLLGVVAGPQETILSALARRILGTSPLYYLVQFSTLAVLAVGANTSFAGFPRIAAILANDRFLPRQLFNVGDRLVFSNGIVLLSAVTALMIILFGGDSHALVPLFAVGAFSAFTLTQAGMVVHWLKCKERGWQVKAVLNGLGALVTGMTTLVVGISKFVQGAWIAILLVPVIILVFTSIRRHYQSVSNQLSLAGLPPDLHPWPKPRVVIPVSGVHRGMLDAVNFARSISDEVVAVYVDIEPGPEEEELRRRWNHWFPGIPFVVVQSPYRSIVEPLLTFMDEFDRTINDGRQAVLVLPELIPAHAWQEALHNQSADILKNALLHQRRKSGFQRVIIDVPYHLREHAGPPTPPKLEE